MKRQIKRQIIRQIQNEVVLIAIKSSASAISQAATYCALWPFVKLNSWMKTGWQMPKAMHLCVLCMEKPYMPASWAEFHAKGSLMKLSLNSQTESTNKD